MLTRCDIGPSKYSQTLPMFTNCTHSRIISVPSHEFEIGSLRFVPYMSAQGRYDILEETGQPVRALAWGVDIHPIRFFDIDMGLQTKLPLLFFAE